MQDGRQGPYGLLAAFYWGLGGRRRLYRRRWRISRDRCRPRISMCAQVIRNRLQRGLVGSRRCDLRGKALNQRHEAIANGLFTRHLGLQVG